MPEHLKNGTKFFLHDAIMGNEFFINDFCIHWFVKKKKDTFILYFIPND
jgi:hypothetical protein